MIHSSQLDATVEVNGIPTKIRDMSHDYKAMMGFAHFSGDIARRERHLGIGIDEPENCTRADETSGTWINYGQNLVCPGCGLDFT